MSAQPKPREVIHSALMRSIGFRRYCAYVHQPRSPAERRLLGHVRAAAWLDKIASEQDLKLWLRYGPPMPAEVRAEAGKVWQGYKDWRLAREGKA